MHRFPAYYSAVRNAANTVVRSVLGVLSALLIGYLGLIASWPHLREQLPSALRWFGQPNSAVTIAIVVTMLGFLAAVLLRSGSGGRSGAPVAIVGALAVISALLGAASYWRCRDDSHPTFFTPLQWTADLVKGVTSRRALDTAYCPVPAPVALDVAELCALGALFLSVVGVAVKLFQARLDRLRVYLAKGVTAVVALDDDSKSMISAIKRTLAPRSILTVITDAPDQPYVNEARNQGARIVTADFTRPDTWKSMSLWRKLDTLYLLSSDPAANLARLAAISDHTATGRIKQRIPLIVRIDDPWQATAWRALQFGNIDRRWAADAVGGYEVTARMLVGMIDSDATVERILICGTSHLTLALCAELSQRQLERDYYDRPPLPDTTLIGDDAEDYRADHEYSRRQLGLPHDRPEIRAVSSRPTVPLLMSLIDDEHSDPATTVVIIVDGGALTGVGTRLAVRYPDTAIYAWDPSADRSRSLANSSPLVGRLRTYQLTMDIPDGEAHDAWELAARLIHERYAKPGGTPATRPWPELSEFYRESNRRQVSNALWMVEKIGGHTWNTWGAPADSWSPAHLRGLSPLEQLQTMGFDKTAALKMAQAEHEDWCRFYRRYGWAPGDHRDDSRRIHPNLIAWSDIQADPQKLESALSSLAATLSKLRELGYRSQPVGRATR